MSILMAAFLGLVQGITEFLPVSSSGHLSIIQNLFKMDYSSEGHLLFDVLLHLGTLAAVCLVYRSELSAMINDGLAYLTGKIEPAGEDKRLKPSLRSIVLIIVGTLPLAFILPIHSKLESLYYNTPFISFALIITGLLIFVSDKLQEGRKNEKTSTIADAFIVGLSQAIATIPGLSRSGTTITVGLSRGFRRDFAVRFSFLLSIPAILGSTFVTLISAIRSGIVWSNIPAYLIGTVIAGVVGYFCLGLLKKLISNGGFGKFAYYCWFAGIISLILSFIV